MATMAEKQDGRSPPKNSLTLNLPKGVTSVTVPLEPPALRLANLERDELPPALTRVDNARYRGRLHPNSGSLTELIHLHMRRIALSRLAYGGQSTPCAEAHFDAGICYARMGLWSQALSHAKKSLYVHDRVAPGAFAKVDPRVLRSIFEGVDPACGMVDVERIACAILRSEYARDFSPILTALATTSTQQMDLKGLVALSQDALHHSREHSAKTRLARGRTLTLLGRCYVHSPLRTGKRNRVVEAQKLLAAAMDVLGLPKLGCEQEEEDSITEGSVGDGVPQRDLCLARAELCCALGELRMDNAMTAEHTLKERTREAAEEWLLGEEGQAALVRLTREYTEKAVRSGKTSKDIVSLRESAEARATAKLLHDTSTTIRTQLMESPETGNVAGGRAHREAVVEWFVRAWVLREVSYDRNHPEMGLIYERLGEAHLQCETPEGNEEAASMFRTALNILRQTPLCGTGEPITARVAARLGRAESLCEVWAEAASAYSVAAEFFQAESARGARLEESPESSRGDADEDDVLVINHKGRAPLVVSVLLGVLPAAEKAREFWHVAAGAYGKCEEWLDARNCLARAVQMSTTYYGAGSVETAEDLLAIGRLCLRPDVSDYRYAEKALVPAASIYRMHLGKSHKKTKAAEALLREIKSVIAGGQ
jgi:tetratricopeptide (TPR) repeat protein